MAIRILIGDDHGLIRAGLRALLNADDNYQVIGEAADGEEVLRLAAHLKPDLVLLDMSMPGPGGIEITRELNRRVPSTRVLILTIHEDMGLMREAIRAGAAGYIIKRAVDFELLTAIQTVMRGDLYLHPSMTFVRRLVIIMRHLVEASLLRIVEQFPDLGVQPFVVLLHAQNIVGPLLDDLAGNRLLAADRIDRHNTARDF